MGRRENYKGYLWTANEGEVRSFEGDGVSVTGTVCYVLAESWVPLRMAEYLTEWDQKRSYKIGINVGQRQHVVLAYRARDGGEIPLRKDDAVTAELQELLGSSQDREWRGFVPETKAQRWYRFEEPNTVYFELSVRIRPADAKRQVIPFVARHANGSFAEGHMTGLWELPGRPAAG